VQLLRFSVNMWNRRLWNVLCFVILISLSSCFAKAEDQNFELGGKEGSANAIFTGGEFKLDVDIGPPEDYKVDRVFVLTIGECEAKITAYDSRNRIQYDFEKDGALVAALYGLDSVVVTNSSKITFGGKPFPQNVTCAVDFGNEKNGLYYVPVKLSGDVPKGLKLSSKTIKMGDRPGEEKLATPIAGAGSKTALIVGLCVGGVFLVLASSGGIGFFVYRWRKNKILQEQREKKQVESGKSVEAAIPTDSKTPEPKAQDPKTTDSKAPSKIVEADKKDAKSKDGSKEKKDVKSKEPPKDGSKEKKSALKEAPSDTPKDNEAPKEKEASPKERSGREKKKTEEDENKPWEDKDEPVYTGPLNRDRPEEGKDEPSRRRTRRVSRNNNMTIPLINEMPPLPKLPELPKLPA